MGALTKALNSTWTFQNEVEGRFQTMDVLRSISAGPGPHASNPAPNTMSRSSIVALPVGAVWSRMPTSHLVGCVLGHVGAHGPNTIIRTTYRFFRVQLLFGHWFGASVDVCPCSTLWAG